MKKIVFDGAIFSLQKTGGISRAWADILLHLDQHFSKRLSMTALIPKNSNVEWARVAPQIKNITIVPRRRFRWGKHDFLQRLYLTYQAFSLSPDIWHSSYYVGYPFGTKAKRVVMFYDMIPEMLGQAVDYDRYAKAQTLLSSDGITPISENSLNDLHRVLPDLRAQTKVTFLFPRQTEPRKTSNPFSFPYFLFTGKRGGYKNFLPVLKTVLEEASFATIHLVSAGDGSDWTEEEKAVLKKHNAFERVHKVGIVESEELESFIQHSEALLYPSLYEGFGLPVLEGFQYDTPVLACNTSSIPELTGQEYPLCDPSDEKSWKAVLKELMSNKEKWTAYGRERLELFTIEKTVEDTVAFYDSLLQ